MKGNIEDVYPLSPMQQGMLFHALDDQATPGVYLQQLTCALRGHLDAPAFRRAWERVLERHPALRSAFFWKESDRPLQVVYRQVSLPWEELDWRGAPAAERERLLDALLEAHRQRGFDLAKAPLMRLVLVREEDGLHRLAWSHHHLLLDGWSLPLLINEVLAFYEAFRNGRDAHLPVPRPFRDYIAWLGRQDTAAAEAFWRRWLAGFTTPTPLGIGHEAALDGGSPQAPQETSVLLPASAAAALQSVARRCEITLGTLVHGAWALLLERYSGEEDVVFGATVSGRPADLPGAEGMIGLFINTLPVRVRTAPRESAAAWLRRVQEGLVEMRRYEHTPLFQAQGWSEVPRGRPLFESLLVFENYPAARNAGGQGEQGEPEIVGLRAVERTHYPLTAIFAPRAGMALRLLYDPGRFDAATVERLAGHMVRLLEGLGEDPERPAAELPLLSEGEERQLLIDWRAAPVEAEGCLHELFLAQAERTPTATALVCGGRRLTYAELAGRAGRLASALRARGVGPEVPVGLCMERSEDMIVALLGVLAAGGAYVPLDPGYPAERLAFMIEDAGVLAVLTQERLRTRLPAGAPAICLDGGEISEAGEEGGAEPARPGNLAYLIYTSGSTGRPKGVAIEHRSAVALVRWALGVFSPAELAGVLAATSINFDLSVFEIFVPLSMGGTVVLVEDALRLPSAESAEGVTLVNTVPSAMAELVRGGGLPSSVRTVNLAGEPLRRALVEGIYESSGVEAVLNLYGPSEDTTYSTFVRLGRGEAGEPTIGRAISGTSSHVLDRQGRLLPVGVAGELYLGGAGLARGYQGRPELTAERFVPDPFGGAGGGPGARLYRTGDLARFRPDGEIEFLGRLDHQVKIRGFRIELGEIEAALTRHPAVREVCVLAREDHPGDKRLVAYVAARDVAPGARELRAFLQERLPAYMMPAHIMVLDALPHTPNGKVDRRALPSPTESRLRLEEDFVPPRTPQEAALAKIWGEVLRLERVGVGDNFFELGGDSILSIQVVSRAVRAGLSLTPGQIFRHPTIAELAAVAAAPAAATASQDPVTGAVTLTPIQRWFFELDPADRHHWNQALLLDTRAPVPPPVIERALATLLDHHDALRTGFERGEPGWRQRVEPGGGPVPFSQVDLSALPQGARGPEVTRGVAALQGSLDLAAGPLLRAALFDLGEGEPGRLLLILHHLVVDGVSWRVLLEDLQTACEGGALPAKTTSFQRWAERLAEHAGSEAVAGEAAYWLSGDRTRAARLPVDGPGGEDVTASARFVSAALSEEETRALLQEVPRAYRTQINDVLLTALAQALAGWTGEPRVLIDLEGHGREEIGEGLDLSRTVGWFTTLFPVLLDLEGAAGPADALQRVKEQLRAVPARGLGYGLLRYLRDDQELADRLRALPASEVSFNYLGQLDQALPAGSPFAPAPELAGPSRSPRGRRPHPLAVEARVAGGRLHLTLAYGERLHRRPAIERLAQDLLAALSALIAHCRRPDALGYTPSDFPLARLDPRWLDGLAAAGRRVEDVYPLSPMQEGMLFQSLVETGCSLYFEQLSWTLRGELDTDAFRRAWELAAERHPTLRTAFAWEGVEQPVQVVYETVEIPWRDLDWTALTEGEQRASLEELRREDRRHGFDLAAAPALGLSLIRLAADRWELVLNLHDAFFDGWSLALLLEEVFAAYRAFADGRQPALQRPRPYRDYIAWLQGQDTGRAEEFWRRMMAGFGSPTPLGIDRSAGEDPGAPTEGFGRSILQLGAAEAEGLRAWTRRHQLTLNTLVQGVWAILLSRYSGERDVVFGTTVAGRPTELAGVERILGLFLNTLPVRARMALGEPLPGWLKRLQDEQAEMRQYEHTPLSQVHGWSEVPRKQPLFESLFIFENFPMDDSLREAAEELEVSSSASFQRTAFPLSLVVMPRRGLSVRASYDPRRLDGTTVSRLLGHFEALLAAAVSEPERTLGELPMLTPAERHQALVEWSRSESPLPPERCIHELFEEQVARVPGAPAAVYEERSLTYRELNRRANRLARHLREMGVGPEVPVGVCAPRSLETIAGYLAVLKAGGFFVPLDPTYPQDRLRYMLESARASVLLSLGGRGEGLSGDGIRVVPLEPVLNDADEASEEWDANPASGAAPGNAVYTIFTSGSTGRPKGVLVEHRHLLAHLHAILERLDLPAAARIANVSTISADVGKTPIFGALCFGGCLNIFSEDRATSPGEFAEALRRDPVDFLKIVPSHVNALRSAAGAAFRMPRHRMLVGGETFFWKDALEAQGLAPEVRIFNHYGPTETTVGVMTYRVQPQGFTASGKAWLPLGRPMGAARIYLLDRHGQPAPVGAPAEIFIGGRSVSRGYLHRPDVTAKRFVPDPFGDEPGARLYRSGDIGSLLPDGNVDFLGRVDHQIKVRGFRVELEEIAALLRAHPEIREAVVVARPQGQGDTQLAAYLVARSEPHPQTAALRDYLAEKLPGYMVPAAFVFLAAMPLNPNGKIDRQALPEPGRMEPGRQVTPPRTEVEAGLAGIWSNVLGVGGVGVEDDFFDLGGNSLSAIRILARVKESFGVDLPARRFFEAQSLAETAAAIDEIRTAGTPAALPAALDLDAEAVLDPTIPARTAVAAPAGAPAEVLLTGATGFVGGFLLHELLRQTGARVHCLVRAGSEEEALGRLRRSLRALSLWDDSLDHRIVPLPGDLSMPWLGLAPERFRELAGRLDAIYHNGALVNFAYPYAALKRPNVLGTQEVLRLASEERATPVHFVSTISVFDSDAFAGRELADEMDDPSGSRGLADGYVQSKWVAERLVKLAGARGLPVAIYRLGRVSWHSRTGAWAETDFVNRMMKSCIQLGCAPELDRFVALTPVDYVSRALVALSLREAPRGQAFHLTNPRPVPWGRLVDWIQERGYGVRRVPFHVWQRELLGDVRGSADNALYPLAAFSAPAEVSREQTDVQLRQLERQIVVVGCPFTAEALEGTGIELPRVDGALAEVYFERAVETGYLDAPTVMEDIGV